MEKLLKLNNWIFLMFGITLGLLCYRPQLAGAAEGAASDYFPGAYGTFAVALPPPPGFLLANLTLIYDAKAHKAVLDGRVDADLKTFAVYDLIMGFYTFEKPVLGAKLQIGGFVPIGYVHLDAKVTTPLGTTKVSDDETNIGDFSLQPVALYWSKGNFEVKFAELIYMPTGYYNVNNNANIGRNYWAFDTTAALAWFNQKTGTEIAAIPGFMANTRNDETDYTTGAEFHLDFMVNQFLSEQFALGFQGYYYQQVTGDSGSGALLGDFKGESVGIGPAVLWMPTFGKGKLSLAVKWLHDVDATNRLKADYGQTTIGYQF